MALHEASPKSRPAGAKRGMHRGKPGLFLPSSNSQPSTPWRGATGCFFCICSNSMQHIHRPMVVMVRLRTPRSNSPYRNEDLSFSGYSLSPCWASVGPVHSWPVLHTQATGNVRIRVQPLESIDSRTWPRGLRVSSRRARRVVGSPPHESRCTTEAHSEKAFHTRK